MFALLFMVLFVMRSNSLDLLKLLASFCIISLHVGLYPDLKDIYGELIRISGRWAVPFFFLVTGFFIGMSKSFDLEKRVFKIISIMLWSSLLFIPYVVVQNDFKVLDIFALIFSYDTLHHGSYFHLWYLSSMILGLVLFKLSKDTLGDKLVILLASVIVVMNFITDLSYSYDNVEFSHSFTRHMISFSFIAYGYYLSKVDISNFKSNVLYIALFFSVILMLCEPFLFNWEFKKDVIDRQFPIGVVPFCIILFIIALKFEISDNIFSRIGRKYSLFIYVLHPLLIPVVWKSARVIDADSSIIVLLVTFVLTIILSFILKKTLFELKLSKIRIRT